jgi:hypothetical protein
MLDGRDTNAEEDVWIEGVVNAKAPAGTVAVRVSLFFIQLARVQGDYNGNGTVDAADYTVWRDHLGNTGAPGIPGDGDDGTLTGTPDGMVDAADYAYWKERFGIAPAVFGDGGASWFDDVSLVRLTPSGLGSISLAAVPEPATISYALFVLLFGWLGQRRLSPCHMGARSPSATSNPPG